MPECVKIIPRAKIARIARLTKETPDWKRRLGLLSAEGCLCIMQEEGSEQFYAILLEYPNCFKSFSGDLTVENGEIRLITKNTGYVFSVTEWEMTKEKEDSLRSQLQLLLTELEAEEALN